MYVALLVLFALLLYHAQLATDATRCPSAREGTRRRRLLWRETHRPGQCKRHNRSAPARDVLSRQPTDVLASISPFVPQKSALCLAIVLHAPAALGSQSPVTSGSKDRTPSRIHPSRPVDAKTARSSVLREDAQSVSTLSPGAAFRRQGEFKKDISQYRNTALLSPRGER